MASSYIRSLLSRLAAIPHPETLSDSQPISAHALTSKAGAWYEKIRYLLDYQEERAIKRNAIERILKRKIILEGQSEVGATLLHELLSASYITEAQASEEVGQSVQGVVVKYLSLLSALRAAGHNGKLEKTVVSFAATEIYRSLFPSPVDDLVINAFYEKVRGRVEYTPAIPNAEADLQTYIGCRRAYLKENEASLLYALWVRSMPSWPGSDASQVPHAASVFAHTVAIASREIKRPLGVRVSARLRDYGIYFFFIKEIIERYGSQSERVLDDQVALTEDIEASLATKYTHAYSQARRSGLRAVFYILVTKVVLAFILEVPYDLLFVGAINYLALGINVLFHPLLLLVMTNTIRPLGKDNTERIITGVQEVATDDPLPMIRVKTASTYNTLQLIYLCLYLALFAVSFGAIIALLHHIGFNIVSIGLFVLFVTLVSYFGLRIRHHAREWSVSTPRKNAWVLLWDLFTFPIVQMGKWLSQKFSTINIFVWILDFIIETPFKLLLQVLDSFFAFLKEKHDEIM